MIYELSPPVVYYDSETLIYFDPKSTMSLIKDLPTDEMAFINAKVGGVLMDFENSVDFDFSFNHYHRNNVKGRVGDQKPSSNHDLSMLWEIGNSKINMGEALHCSYDNSTCYVAKTVPVIFGMNYNSGYTTGGQIINVTGWGFNNPNITASLDGQSCTILSFKDDSFECQVGSKSAASVIDVPTIGQHGLRKTLINSSMS
jgi:hypothetical protein